MLPKAYFAAVLASCHWCADAVCTQHSASSRAAPPALRMLYMFVYVDISVCRRDCPQPENANQVARLRWQMSCVAGCFTRLGCFSILEI
jgi:hypothetical protein